MRIGVATGEALVGSIGSDVMMSYTLMGDVVNLASRLEGANKMYGTRNLVCERTIAAARTTLEVREVDRIVVAGQTRPKVVFEVLGRRGELTPERLASRDRYQEGLVAYRERRWDDALRALNARRLIVLPGSARDTRPNEPVSAPCRTSLSRSHTDIENCRAETGARNPPRKGRNTRNCQIRDGGAPA